MKTRNERLRNRLAVWYQKVTDYLCWDMWENVF